MKARFVAVQRERIEALVQYVLIEAIVTDPLFVERAAPR
jgi:hypothetical protein